MSTPAPPSTATTTVDQIEEAPVAVPDDDASTIDIPSLGRTFTTPDGVPITVMEKPSPKIVRRQSSIPKGTTIDGVISPKQPRPAKSFPEAPALRPASPARAQTAPANPAPAQKIFPVLTERICLFPDHVTIREVTVIMNDKTITDRAGDVLFRITHKERFTEPDGKYVFDVRKSCIPWKRRWYLQVWGERKITMKRKRTKKGRNMLHCQLTRSDRNGVVDIVLQNGMMRLGHSRQNLLVAIVEDVRNDDNTLSGRRMRVAMGFDLAIASAMCFILYGGTAKKRGRM